MTWSFRKRIKIIPGVHLNLSKSGISTSIDVRDANLTFGRSYLNPVEPSGNIFSADIHEITSQNMQGVKEAIILASQQKKELQNDLLKIQKALGTTQLKLSLSYIFLYGFIKRTIPEGLKADIEAQKEAILQTKDQVENCYVKLDIEFDPLVSEKYYKLVDAFKKLITCHRIWDVTSAHSQDRVAARSSASTLVNKREVKFSLKSLPDMRSSFEPLYFQNANGADLYFYPSFIVMYSDQSSFAIIGLDEIELQQNYVRFTETGTVPRDSKVIDKTWAKVNKNGSPDKRFKGNYQIPIVRYGEIKLRTSTGLNEEYEFSNYEFTEDFGWAFKEYQATVRQLRAFSKAT